ncbi:MAG: 2'-deoxycytidine 5'-triphosphate deaminase [Pseudomonadota bacterium]
MTKNDTALLPDGEGVFTEAAYRAAIAAEVVRLDGAATPTQVQPSSLDLTLGPVAYRLRASFLPGPKRTVEARMAEGLLMHELDLTRGAVLERGCVYLVPLRERLALPDDIAGFANPKSSTGRIDVFTRLITDQGKAFDDVPAGYAGPLYAEISPRTFSIVAREGSALNQLRLRRGDARLDDAALAALQAADPVILGEADISNGVALTVNLAGGADDIVGYRAKRHAPLIDVDRVGAYDPVEYWDPIIAPKRRAVTLDPDEFYILASKEALRIPPDYAAEMAPFNPLVGEFRVHYAGFFDPGFGCAEAGGEGGRGVLEVRSHEVPFVMEDGQIIGRLIYERLMQRPERLYGQDVGSNYQRQGLKLSKHFKAWSA